MDRKVRWLTLFKKNWDPIEKGFIPTTIFKIPVNIDLIKEWIEYCRNCYETGELSEEQLKIAEKLIASKKSSDQPRELYQKNSDEQWLARFEELKRFVKEHGRAQNNGKRKPTSERLLGDWLKENRQRYKKGRLSEERARLVGSIVSIESNTKEDHILILRSSWEYHFELYLEFDILPSLKEWDSF